MKTVTISKGQHLTDVYTTIETDTILCKTLTGLGATYSEIKSDRDSIIVVPNLPAISCKCALHKADNLFGVRHGITADDVCEYLQRTIDSNKRIKLIVTPESFYKVKEAFDEIDEDMYARCFLLLDECHKLVKDRDYRPDITLPVNDFFKFIDKALVSAAPIIPSDPRFDGFQLVKVKPDFDYSQDVRLIHTNNMLESVRRVLESEHTNPVCIFANSTDMTYQLITKLGLTDRCSVFCAEKSVIKLKSLGFKSAYEEWDYRLIRQINFFTSRFYNALDIDMPERPEVILLSEPYFADYTIMDPHTDIAQAVGRFRNGITSLTHILTTKPTLPIRTKEGIAEFISGCEKAYTIIRTLHDSSDSLEERASFRTALDSLPYNDFLTGGEVDHFAIDNYTDDEIVKSAYNNIDSVVERYASCGRFNIIGIENQHYPFGESERLSLFSRHGNSKEARIRLVNFLENIKEDIGVGIVDSIVEELRKQDPVLVEAFFKLGKEIIEQCGYRIRPLKEKLIVQEFNERHNCDAFINALKNSFEVGHKYTRAFVKKELIRLYELFGIRPTKKVTAYTIEDYYNVSHTVRIKNNRAILIISSKI